MKSRNNPASEVNEILGRAKGLMAASRFEDAIRTIQRGLTLDPRNRTLLENMFLCNLELGRPKKAVDALSQLVTLDPQSERFWTDKGYLHLLLDEIDEGIIALRRSVQLSPRTARGWELLTRAFMASEDWENALMAVTTALILNPNNAISWYNCAVCCFVLDRYTAAVQAAEFATSIEPALEEYTEGWIDAARDLVEEEGSDWPVVDEYVAG